MLCNQEVIGSIPIRSMIVPRYCTNTYRNAVPEWVRRFCIGAHSGLFEIASFPSVGAVAEEAVRHLGVARLIRHAVMRQATNFVPSTAIHMRHRGLRFRVQVPGERTLA